MKKMQNNKGAIIFYTIIIITGLLLKANNDRYVAEEKEIDAVFSYNNIP